MLVSFFFVFLSDVNEFLRGTKKLIIDALLNFFIIVLIILAFVIAGWKHGLLAIGIFFFSGIIIRPIAARVASKILSKISGSSNRYVGLPPKPLEKISKKLGNSVNLTSMHSMENLLKNFEYEKEAIEELLDYCEKQPSIQTLLKEFNLSRQNLEELYDLLIALGAGQWRGGHWVAASILAYPETLRYLLSKNEEDFQEKVYKLIDYFEGGSKLEF